MNWFQEKHSFSDTLKAAAVAQKLKDMKLPKASAMVTECIHETLEYMHFPPEHWICYPAPQLTRVGNGTDPPLGRRTDPGVGS
jgi:hypothetical protein